MYLNAYKFQNAKCTGAIAGKVEPHGADTARDHWALGQLFAPIADSLVVMKSHEQISRERLQNLLGRDNNTHEGRQVGHV